MLSVIEAVDASAILEVITHWPKGSTPPRTTLLIPYISYIWYKNSHLITLKTSCHALTNSQHQYRQIKLICVDNACLSSSHIILELITHILCIIVYLSYQSLSRTHYIGVSTNQGEARGGQFLPLISRWRAPQLTRIYTIPKELTALCSST